MNTERFIDKDRAQRIKMQIRDVLMRDWDPIGVKDEPMATDEYDSYIGDIYELLKKNSSETAISNHLRDIEISRMGYADHQVPEHLNLAATLKEISLE